MASSASTAVRVYWQPAKSGKGDAEGDHRCSGAEQRKLRAEAIHTIAYRCSDHRCHAGVVERDFVLVLALVAVDQSAHDLEVQRLMLFERPKARATIHELRRLAE